MTYANHAATNKGPNGSGQYDNADNHIAQSGDTWPNEAAGITSEFMAAMPVQNAPATASSRSASEAEMRGGNR